MTNKIAGYAVDAAALAGAASITYGVDLIFHPASYIVGGGFVLLAAWLTAAKGTN